jgi:hypothetical protein
VPEPTDVIDAPAPDETVAEPATPEATEPVVEAVIETPAPEVTPEPETTPEPEPVVEADPIPEPVGGYLGLPVIVTGLPPYDNDGASDAPGIVTRSLDAGRASVKAFANRQPDVYLPSVPVFADEDSAAAFTAAVGFVGPLAYLA